MMSNKGEGSWPRPGRTIAQARASSREGLWCTYCKKPWQVVVLNRNGGFKNLIARNQACLSHKGQEEDKSVEKIEIDSSLVKAKKNAK